MEDSSKIMKSLVRQLAEEIVAQSEMAQYPPSFDTKGASEYTGIGEEELRRRARAKTLPAVKIGSGTQGYFRFSRLVLDKLLAGEYEED